MRRLSSRAVISGVNACLYGSAAFAFADLPRQASLTGNTENIGTPGIGRIVVAFVVTLAVGGALVWLLRRVLPFLPKWGGARVVGSAMRVKASQAIHPALRLHLIEVNGSTVLVAEGRSGISVTVMAPPIPERIEPPSDQKPT
jgi:hypothetical protein